MFELPKNLESMQARLQTPIGPVWRVPHHDLGLERPGNYLIRRLARGSMLKVGALLSLAARCASPNIAVVSHWRVVDGQVWCVCREPDGATPLVERESLRFSWGEAVQMWRALASGVAAMHSLGVIHGHLTPYSVWYDEEAGRLVAVDGGSWVGDEVPADSVWWPPRFQSSADSTPCAGDDISMLVRILLYLHLPQGQAGQLSPSLAGVPGYAIPALERALRDPDAFKSVNELLKEMAPSPIQARQTQDHDSRDVLFGRVFEVDHVEGNEKLGSGVRFRVTHPTYDTEGQRSGYTESRGAFFYERAHGDVYQGMRSIWDGAEINLLDVREVENSSGETFYTAGANTLPVLEPHWPVTVSSVLKAHGCVSRYFVDLRDSGESSRALVFGSLLHGMLEDIVAAGPLGSSDVDSFDAIWDARVPSLRIDMLAAGLSDGDLESFRNDAKMHYEAIASFARRRQQSGQSVGWSGETVEATRYSSIHGLEGRIDLVTEDPERGLQIVELKSGRARDEHVTQVRCYKLLWDGLAQSQDMIVSGHLLYSKEGVLKSAPLEDPKRDRSILRARNQLVSAHRSLARGDEAFEFPYFMQVPQACNASACWYRKDRCSAQTALLGLGESGTSAWPNFDLEVVEKARAYWRHLTRLIELENWVGTQTLGEILQSGRLPERVEAHRAVAGLTLESADPGRGFVTFRGRGLRTFTGRDRILAHRQDFHRSHILRGRVSDVSDDSITIRATGVAALEAMARQDWVLDKVPVRIGYRSAHRSLYRLIDSRRKDLLEVLTNPGGGRTALWLATDGDVDLSEQSREHLNAAQARAVRAGLTGRVGTLIQGPPGTGKTTVIAHLIRELVAGNKTVVVSAQTNTAVDTVLEKLLEVDPSLEFMRVGESSSSRALRDRLKAAGVPLSRRFSDDFAEETESIDAISSVLHNCPVVACTTHRAARSDVIDTLRRGADGPVFDVAIVDEATQITEPMSLAPLVLAKRFVLVGDHRQLPPIVNNEEAQSHFIERWSHSDLSGETSGAQSQVGLFDANPSDSELDPLVESMGLGGLDRSLFERLVEGGAPFVMLEEQFRMHESIMRFSSDTYYGGRLKSHSSVARHQIELEPGRVGARVAPIIEPSSPIVFVDVDAESDGRTNEKEADAVLEVLDAIAAADVEGCSVGVISPFRAQVHMIKSRLGELVHESPGRIDVDTVERFQGGERDIIVVSLVKTDRTGDFLSDPRRLNVTLTRARKKLIIFGHRECLHMDPLFRDLIEAPQTLNLKWIESESKIAG